jgi:uncharacterized protein
VHDQLDAAERRILGVLMEKALATPDSYPLSLRDVTVAANQKSCRDPVTNYQEWEIEGALRSLFEKKWATYVEGGRVRKWKHRAGERLELTPTRAAVMAELLLRGPQQPGELRRNAERLAAIPTDDDLRAILADLEGRTPPLVRNLGRLPRERDVRYGQTLAEDAATPGEGGAVEATEPSRGSSSETPNAPAATKAEAPPRAISDDLSAILRRLDALERDVAALKAASADSE